ncbi:MAG: DUF1365 domain-containing protein [Gammaproteobacteria bacterium]|nr:DUF1365 domain-containing protein [Gammaproteobacteria bacterium]
MHSCLYKGWVRHRRHAPGPHAFRYRVCMLYLDLAELPQALDGHWLWSARRPALARWHRRDHHGDPGERLDESIRALASQRGGGRPEGPIRLLTNPRYFGYGFNPVSFYYCFDASDTRIEAIVAEINNTPWGERHCYVLPSAANAGRPSRLRFRFGKDFHVSPFMPMDLDYDWRFSVPGERLLVHMENWRRGEHVFDATLSLAREPIGSKSLAGALAAYPFMTAKVAGAIYWQALRLWLKRTPFFTHPDETGAGHRRFGGRIERLSP